MLVDACFDAHEHHYTRTEIHSHAGRVLRVRVCRDRTSAASFAVVLTHQCGPGRS